VSGSSRPLVLVGAGKMGGALLYGWLEQGIAATDIVVQDPALSREIAALLEARGVRCIFEPDVSLHPKIVVLAVKPQMIGTVLPELQSLIKPDTVLLSIAAGKTLAGLAALLPEGTAVVRAMPNTPTAIGQGVSVVCANAAATQEQRETCGDLLKAGGAVFWLDDEGLMDAVTAVSGSGPAYVFLLTECMAKAGVSLGLPADLAEELAKLTVAGAGVLMRQSDEPPAQLRQNVTSPNGVTAAALSVLMGEDGMQELLARALKAAAERSKELSS